MTSRVAVLAAAATCCLAPGVASAQAPVPGALTFSSSRCDGDGVPIGGAPGSSMCRLSIFTIHADGTDLRRLTGSSEEDARTGRGDNGDFSPAFSPSGQFIAFSRDTGRGNELFVMRSDGGDQHLLLPDGALPPGANPLQPAWSPAGDKIAFRAQTGSPQTSPSPAFNTGVFVFDLATGEVKRLSQDGQDASGPVFTPDGLAVVYFGNTPVPSGELTDYGLFRTKLDGSASDRMTLGDLQIARDGLSFSPDGGQIAFTGFDGFVYTMDSDGTGLVRRSTRSALGTAWSPIGPTLFYTGPLFDGTSDMAIHRVALEDGAQPVPLTDGRAKEGTPSFSLLGGVLPPVPEDVVPPGVLVEADPGLPPNSRPRRPALTGTAADRIPFLVFDASGLRKVEASLGLRVRRGCRYAGARGRLGRKRRCASPQFATVPSVRAWRRRVARLPAGKYELRFRVRDGHGNVTKHPRKRIVRLLRRT